MSLSYALGVYDGVEESFETKRPPVSRPLLLYADFILSLQPLLHSIIFIIQFTMVTILVRKFNGYYANRPILTTMIVNAVCFSTNSLMPYMHRATDLTAVSGPRWHSRHRRPNPHSPPHAPTAKATQPGHGRQGRLLRDRDW